MKTSQFIALFFFLSSIGKVYAQYKMDYDRNRLSTLVYGSNHLNGFCAELSLTAMFTTGSEDRNGFRWGVGITLLQTVGNWTFSIGADAYKAKQNFGIGTGYAGLQWDNQKKGAAYHLIKYFQGEQQWSGMLRIHLQAFQINFEDDILAYPVNGLKIQDRYRTAAMEIRYKGWIVGTNVFSTDIDGLTDYSASNKNGKYKNGKQISSPVYAGYASHDLLIRLGMNNKIGGFIGQNLWHRYIFNTPDFNQGNYSYPFLQLGIDKPYTLY
jgi:hypothetical protein